jgi:hypothetical protein
VAVPWWKRRESKKATDTGSARGAHGAVVNTGIMENVTVQYGAAVAQSGYARQVRDMLLPAELKDRESELAELAAFCADRDGDPYACWVAPAWSGKSALMSWFFLNPPSGVRMVAFFITARLAAHDDRAGFSGVVLEQLIRYSNWTMPLNSLARVVPSALVALAEERMNSP